VPDIAPHPNPPRGLRTAALPIVSIRSDLYRIHESKHSALFFGKLRRFRWDAPRAEYGVCYLGMSRAAAFIETFGQSPVQTSELAARCITTVRPARPLQLVDLTGPGLARIGADGRLCTGQHSLSRRWSKALYDNRIAPDGILYRARHDPSESCCAIFDRVASSLKTVRSINLADRTFETFLMDLLKQYDFGLIT
jgi:hypothetical protein